MNVDNSSNGGPMPSSATTASGDVATNSAGTDDRLTGNAVVGDDDDDVGGRDMLLKLLDGDSFASEEQRREAEANRRRQLRRKRLREAQERFGDNYAGAVKSDQTKEQEQPEKKTKVGVNPGTSTNGDGTSHVPVADSAADHTTKKFDSKPVTQVRQLGTEIRGSYDAKEEYNGDVKDKEDEDDEFDMFSSSVSPTVVEKSKSSASGTGPSNTNKRGHEQEDWDDAEGYYKAVIGETIDVDHGFTSNVGSDRLSSSSTPAATDGGGERERGGSISFRVLGVIGKGVFSTVLKCSTTNNSTSVELPPVVALKVIRHNETMAKAALSEIRTLQRLKGSQGIVPLLLPTTSNQSNPLEHRGHVIMAFSFMEYNLRDVLQKFGKGVGLSLQAVRSYFGQLLAAATHLKRQGIIHADLKPDNILVSSDFAVVQLADFGSAVDAKAPDQNQPTPYLVSRFYRAPEVILGLAPTHSIDLWSLAVTVAELFLGDVLFRGKSNNDMLYVFMQHLGPFPNRTIRQHMVQCHRFPVPRHFQQEGANYFFTQQTVDPVTGEPVHKVLSLVNRSGGNGGSGANGNGSSKFPLATPLHPRLIKAKSSKDSRSMVVQFSDLLQKCLALDSSRRIALKDALQHGFFQDQPRKTASTHDVVVVTR